MTTGGLYRERRAAESHEAGGRSIVIEEPPELELAIVVLRKTAPGSDLTVLVHCRRPDGHAGRVEAVVETIAGDPLRGGVALFDGDG